MRYRHDNVLPFFKIVQWLLLIEMVFASCPATVESDFRWVVKEKNERLTGKDFLLVGEWWKIDCRINDNTVNATLWQRQIWRKPAFHVQRVVDGKDIKLIEQNVFNITKLRTTDQGRYFCKADCGKEKYAGGIYVNKGVVFATPTIIKIPSNRISKYGSNVTLSCEVNESYGFYQMKWFNVWSGQLMPSKDMSNWSEGRVVQRRVLTISNLNKNDEATYECQLKRHIVHHTALATADITMEDISKPNFVDEPILHVVENGKFTLNYTVDGKPPPNIYWYKLESGNEEKIAWCSQKSNICNTNDKRVKITNSSFTIQDIGFTKNDNVSYICRAENIVGTSSKKYTVLIKRNPRLNRKKCTNLLIYPNKGVQLDCTLSKDNHGKIDFSWHFCCPKKAAKCEKETDWNIVSSDKYLQVETLQQSSSLAIQTQTNVTMLYRCSAKNEIGNDTLTWVVVNPDEPIRAHNHQIPTNNYKITETVLWRFGTIGMGTLFLVALFFNYRERKWRTKYIMEFQAKKCGGTNV